MFDDREQILGHEELVNREALFHFVQKCVTRYGGIAKDETSDPGRFSLSADCGLMLNGIKDLLHAYLGLASLGLFRHASVSPHDPILNITVRAASSM